MKLSIFCSFLLMANSCVFAADKIMQTATPYVVIKSGNVYYVQNSANQIEITSQHSDATPVLSPDKKLIAFIRKSTHIIPNGCDDFADTGSKYGNEIWIYDLTSKKERLIVANNFDCTTPAKKIIDPRHLQFSSDSKILYFITSAWVTSGALHAVNVDGTNLRYVMPANSLEVIPKGQYKDYLIINQHRYFMGGGSFDWYWLFSPDGKEQGPVGPAIEDSQRDILESD